jgi:hypothetical protein
MPSDYSTMSTGLSYLPYHEHPIQNRDFVEKFFNEITLGDEEKRHYLLKVLSSLLDGCNRSIFLMGKELMVNQFWFLLLKESWETTTLLLSQIF